MYIVKNYGFSFSTDNSHIDFKDFFQSIVGQNLSFPMSSGNNREIILDSDSAFFYGVVITIKNQRQYASLISDKNGLSVKITSLAQLEKIAEFNFFIINKKNGFGLYQHHFGACTLPNFASMMTSMYRRGLVFEKEKQLKALGDDAPKKQVAAINSKFFHGLQFQMLVQERDIEKVLDAYKDIRSFKYEVASVESHLNDAVPLQGLVTKSVHQVRFDAGVDKSRIIQGISLMMPMVREKTARVEVLDDEDEPLSLKIMNVPVNYGEIDYNSYMLGLGGFQLDNLKGCALFKSLKHKIEKEYSHVFSKTVAKS